MSSMTRAGLAAPAAVPVAAASADEPRSMAWYRVALVGALIVPVLLLVAVALSSRHATEVQARARLDQVARVAVEHAARVVETNDVVSRYLEQLNALGNDEIRARQSEVHFVLAAMTRGLAQLQSVWVWDEHGRPLASSKFAVPPAIDVSDRSYFLTAMRSRSVDWIVSEPLKSRSTGEPFFDFSRRREAPDGRFTGVISVSLFPAYFNAFFRQFVRSEPGLAMGLVRADGTLIAREPDVDFGTRLPAGSALLRGMTQGEPVGAADGVSPIDGARRMLAWRRVGQLPLYVYAAVREDAVFAPWVQATTLLALFTVPLALGLSALTWIAMRQAQREAAALQASRRQAEERRRMEEALRHAQKLEALGRITGGVAHDFNNVLMVVQNSTALIRRLAERGRPLGPALDAIDRSVTNGSHLTRQLLAFARRQPLREQPVRLQDMLPGWLNLVRATVGSRIEVQGRVDESLLPVKVDVAELELALINLAVNARDAMADGGRLDIGACLVERAELPPNVNVRADAARLVALTVSDTGVGVPDALREMVFEPFFTTKSSGSGTGLGLSQVYGFATQAGGTVRLDSEVGRGTTVTLYLPCCDEPAVQPAPSAAPQAGFEGHVLLVDDHADVTSVMAPLLEQLGARVTVCGHAAEALAALERLGPAVDVVLSDITMPGDMDGIELAAVLGRTHPRLPVVLMTGYAANLKKALSLGIEVLAKPCGAEAVSAAIRRAVERQRGVKAA